MSDEPPREASPASDETLGASAEALAARIQSAAEAIRAAETELERARTAYDEALAAYETVCREAVHGLRGQWPQRLREYVADTLETVRKHPGPSVAVAGLIGLMLGRIGRR